MAAAASYDHVELVEYLLQHGANVNLRDNDGNTALHFCETARAAKLLVDAGADLTLANSEDATAADVALEEGFEDVLAFLINCASSKS